LIPTRAFWLRAASALTLSTAGILPALAETIALTATLSPAAEVPPADSRGSGKAAVSYDTVTHTLSWTIQYSGLTSAPTAAHFHGPAPAGQNAPIVIPLTELASPATGTEVLDDAQADELLSGQLYLNFHTPAYPAGEIRGQVTRAQ
jgi:hypothetical protein